MGLGTMPTVECWWTRMLGRDAEAGVVAWDDQDENYYMLERVVEAEACSRNTSFPPGRPTTSEARPTPSRLRTEELPLLEDVFYAPVDFDSMVISTKRISFIYSL